MMLDFVQHNPDAFLRSSTMGHFTASAWILNQTLDKALLMHHRKLNKWLQLGGHCDGDDNLIRVAHKEAQEESGIDQINMVSDTIFDIDIHLIPARTHEPMHYHYDVRFLFQTLDSIPLIINHESRGLAWVKFDDIHTLTEENSVLRMAYKSKNLEITIPEAKS